MRKITNNAVNAFLSRNEFKQANTEVLHKAMCSTFGTPKGDHFTVMELYGNAIAAIDSKDGMLSITNAGWQSNTTKERLNGLPNVSICQKNFVWYLNGKIWDGSIIKVGRIK